MQPHAGKAAPDVRLQRGAEASAFDSERALCRDLWAWHMFDERLPRESNVTPRCDRSDTSGRATACCFAGPYIIGLLKGSSGDFRSGFLVMGLASGCGAALALYLRRAPRLAVVSTPALSVPAVVAS